MNLTVYPPGGPGSIPSHGGVFQEIFLWLITLCQPVLSQPGRKWLNLPSMEPTRPVDSEEEGRMEPHGLWTARRKAEWNHTACEQRGGRPNGTTRPVDSEEEGRMEPHGLWTARRKVEWNHTACGQRGGRPKSNHGKKGEKCFTKFKF